MKLNIQLFAHTNATTNYELPQFIGTDKPTWLGDFNEAMADIDAGMHENASDIASMETDVATASAAASQASSDVSTLTGTVNTLSSTVSSVQTTANNASQTASSALNTANTANGKADTNATNIATNTSNISALNTKVTNISEFSTTEQLIGKWVDGKDLYRKVFSFNASANTANRGYHNILDYDKIWIDLGNSFIESSTRSDPLGRGDYRSANYQIGAFLTLDNHEYYVICGPDTLSGVCYITINYTKSSD